MLSPIDIFLIVFWKGKPVEDIEICSTFWWATASAASSLSETSSATAGVTSTGKATRCSAFRGTTGTVGVRIVVHNDLTSNVMGHTGPSFLVLVDHEALYMIRDASTRCSTCVRTEGGVHGSFIVSKFVLIRRVLFNIIESFIIILQEMLVVSEFVPGLGDHCLVVFTVIQ